MAMKTTVKTKKPRRKIVGYIVLASGGGFMHPEPMVGLGAILVPATSPVQFPNRRKARRLVVRTECAVSELRGSLIGDWPRLKPLYDSLPLRIQPVHGSA
jgi:hypothetical protein